MSEAPAKYLKPYLHPSMKYYEQSKASDLAKFDEFVRAFETSGSPLALELAEGVKRDLDWLDHLKEDCRYFADEALCGDKDYWIDMKSYHLDQADECFRQVEGLKELREFGVQKGASKETLDNLDKEIDKVTRFGFSHRKKAAGGEHRWYQQARIRAKMVGECND